MKCPMCRKPHDVKKSGDVNDESTRCRFCGFPYRRINERKDAKRLKEMNNDESKQPKGDSTRDVIGE